MMEMAVLEQEKTSLMDSLNQTGAQSELALNNRIEALKELTLALLKQVEALGGTRPAGGARRKVSLYDEVRRFETEIIRYALMRTGGSQRRAARLLGVKATTLNAKIKRYGIDIDGLLSGEAAAEGGGEQALE
ncbi:MAG: helix-turn-helix domain-containing protein [Pyrinomonadaceae bacterium]